MSSTCKQKSYFKTKLIISDKNSQNTATTNVNLISVNDTALMLIINTNTNNNNTNDNNDNNDNNNNNNGILYSAGIRLKEDAHGAVAENN